MSLTKRLEKEIDYAKAILGILVMLVAGLVAWFVNTNDSNTNLVFKVVSIVLFLLFLYGIIKQDRKVNKLLDELEKAND